MMPTIGPKQGKVWGTTQLGLAYNGVSAHALVIEKGGYCSIHHHRHKWNRFHVLQGELAVRVFWFADGSVCHEPPRTDETVLGPGQITDVPPGMQHQFEALEPVLAVEYYWTELDENDIDRGNSIGGIP